MKTYINHVLNSSEIYNKKAIYVKHNTEVLSWNHCCRVKAMSISTTWVCVFVALGIQYSVHMHHNVVCALSAPLYNNFPYCLINCTIFDNKLLNLECVFWFSLQVLFETFLIMWINERDTIKMYFGLHVKYSLFLSDFNENWIVSSDFDKSSNIKFHENPSSGSRVVPCGQTVRQTDMTKLVVAFHNFSDVPKTYNFPLLLYGCGTWSVTLRKEQGVMVFENRVLRKIFGPRRIEVTGK